MDYKIKKRSFYKGGMRVLKIYKGVRNKKSWEPLVYNKHFCVPMTINLKTLWMKTVR